MTLPIRRVVVHPDGALVTRAGSLEPLAGQLQIRELPLLLDPTSVRLFVIRTGGGPSEGGFTVHVELDALGEDRGPKPPPLERYLQARDDLTRTQAALAAKSRTRAALVALVPGAPRSAELPVPDATRWLAWAASAELVSASLARMDDELRALERTRQEQTEQLAIFEHQLRQESAEAWWKRWRPTRRVRVEVEEDGPVQVELSYRVPGASWTPAYTLEADGALKTGRFSMRALVVQATGEDWRQAKLSLSSAPCERTVDVPELAALRLGTRQPEARSGWRELPTDHDALFPADLPVPQRRPSEPVTTTLEIRSKDVDVAGITKKEDALDLLLQEPMAEDHDEVPEDGRRSGNKPASVRMKSVTRQPAPQVQPLAKSAPTLMGRAMAMMPEMAASLSAPAPASSKGGGGYQADTGRGENEPEEAQAEVGGDWLDYGRMRLMSWEEAPGKRGMLRPLDEVGELRELGLPPEAWARFSSWKQEMWSLVERTRRRPLPPSHVLPGAIGGSEALIEAAGTVDLPSDGRSHTVAVQAWAAELSVSYRAVPRHDLRAFRLVTAKVSYPHPLLPGPVDVYVDGRLELTSPWAGSPGRGELKLGLGAEDRLKLARNVRYHEESAGLLGGSRKLVTRIEIKVASSMGQAVKLELLERLPVPSDAQKVVIESIEASPAAYPYTGEPDGPILKGGRRQVLELPPGEERAAVLAYAVTLAKGEELVGGERRG
jgi:hypothetical protein